MDYGDQVDRNLIGILEENARFPISELARRVGLARSSVQERLDRLERRGVILGYRAIIGRAEQAVKAYVFLSVKARDMQRLVIALREFPEIVTAEAVSGQSNIICNAALPQLEDLEALVEELAGLPGVEGATYAVVMSEKINRNNGLI